jgi:spermidine synthase
MAQPWETLDRVETAEGLLELRRRGADDFLILVGGRVLMASRAHRSESILAAATCARLAGRARPRLLIGGLGMGFTLRAALDALPAAARVVVAELTPAVVAWCRGPLAALIGRAVADSRVKVEIADVAERIDAAARAGGEARFDAVLLDLYEGPRERGGGASDPLYGRQALAAAHEALVPGGVFAVWSEDPDAAFERRLTAAGFRVERVRARRGPRHVVYLAERDGAPPPAERARRGRAARIPPPSKQRRAVPRRGPEPGDDR